jgi:adenylate cyclase
MAVEIERRFLVRDDGWRAQVYAQTHIMQGYLANNAGATIRVRVMGDEAFLTIEGAMQGISRTEFEYSIPVAHAEAMLRELAVSPPIDKLRHAIRIGRHLWDVDVFGGENAGLVTAEVELTAADDTFEMPSWVGQEVTGEPRYYAVNLARNPFKHW